jgi:hypothetical protein
MELACTFESFNIFQGFVLAIYLTYGLFLRKLRNKID